MSKRPTVGMIVPPADGAIPPECPALYGDRADFIAVGLGLERMSAAGYGRVIDRVESLARQLAARGADAVALMGTSLSFFQGAAFNRRLLETLRSATGLPATTMSSAVIEAMRLLGARRVAVGTAYAAAVNKLLREFLATSGIAAASLVSLDIEAVEAVLEVTDDDLLALGRRAWAGAPDADALFISCGGLQTLDVTRRLEEEFGKPVVSSAVAGAWAALRLTGLDASAPGHGRLLEHH